MAGLGKQAKILTDKQIALALAAVAARRYPLREAKVGGDPGSTPH